LSFAIGIYLPLSNNLPIFIGGAIRRNYRLKKEKSDEVVLPKKRLEKVICLQQDWCRRCNCRRSSCFLAANDSINKALLKISVENGITETLAKTVIIC